jgi:hypothetical protein
MSASQEGLCSAEWSLILREEYKLRLFETRVLRRIFGPKREEITKECREVHKDEFLICAFDFIDL